MTERRPRRRGAEPPTRVLTDPRAIRALAHPARLAVLEALDDAAELTATDCAEIAGLSPSAMSYHLRALEKWGFLERVEKGGDGRERPWRRVAGGWNIEAMPDAATAAATSTLTTMTLERAAADLERWFAREREQPQPWRDAATLENRFAWLTSDEADELRDLLEDFFRERKGRTAKDHPEGARRVRALRILAPLKFD